MVDITAAVITAFRTQQPAFADDTAYPDATVTLALCEGDVETGGRGWGSYADDCKNFKQRGMFLYAAHWLASTYPSGVSGGESGAAAYAVSGKSVDDESINYAIPSDMTGGAGDAWLGTTAFGQQWLRLRARAGMGARAV